jgi:predicted Zn-dependent protease
MRMRSSLGLVAVMIAVTGVVVACHKVPYTNRLQFKVVPDAVMRGLGKSTYGSMLEGQRLQKSGANHDVLQRVGRRVSRAAKQPKFDWQFTMIDDPMINAWCLPGGYIGFYTGILPVLQNESGMAFVMGHEVAHATAHHGAERLSQNLALVGGLGVLQAVVSGSGKLSPEQQNVVFGALGVGAQVGVLLPFSRKHESEADVIGLMYMSTAGYVPQESIRVWDRMSKLTGGASGPTFLSTHPSHAQRQKKLTEWMDRAAKRYERTRRSEDTLRNLWAGAGAASSGSTSRSGSRTGTSPPPPSNDSGSSRDRSGSRGTR